MDDIIELARRLIRLRTTADNPEARREAVDLAVSLFAGRQDMTVMRALYNGSPSVLIANATGTALDALLLGHADVVPAPDEAFVPRADGDRLYGRGAQDMKGMVAVMLTLLAKERFPGLKIGALVVTDEETGGTDGAARWAGERGLKPAVVLDLDSGADITTVISKAKAPLFVKLRATGVAAHGARPWLGLDANEDLLRTISALRNHFPYYSQRDHIADEWIPTMHVGTFGGGRAVNVISDAAEAMLDFRLTDALTAEDVLDLVRRNSSAAVTAEIVTRGRGVNTDTGHPLMKRYVAIVEETVGTPVAFKGANGASDARYFADGRTLIISHQATGGGLHDDGEWVGIKSLGDMYAILRRFCLEFGAIRSGRR